MGNFQYEWWTVTIRDESGVVTYLFKGRSKESVIKQINKEVAESKSEQNKNRDCWHRKPEIIEVKWDTMSLVKKGYQREF